MRLVDTFRRLATSAMRVAAKPRSMTTSHVVSKMSWRRSSTVCFFTGLQRYKRGWTSLRDADNSLSSVGPMTRLTALSRSIAGKRAIVTGAASGMGRATAHLFADEGARVAVVDLSGPKVQAVVDEIT